MIQVDSNDYHDENVAPSNKRVGKGTSQVVVDVAVFKLAKLDGSRCKVQDMKHDKTGNQ